MPPENSRDGGFKGTRLSHGAPYGPITAVRRILKRRRLSIEDADFEGALEIDGDAFEIANEFANSD